MIFLYIVYGLSEYNLHTEYFLHATCYIYLFLINVSQLNKTIKRFLSCISAVSLPSKTSTRWEESEKEDEYFKLKKMEERKVQEQVLDLYGRVSNY